MNALYQKWLLFWNLKKLYAGLKTAADKLKAVFKSEGIVNSKTLFQSKKSLIFVLSMVSLFATQYLGMSKEQVDAIMKAIEVITGMYIGGQTIHDAVLALNQPTVVNTPPVDEPK